MSGRRTIISNNTIVSSLSRATTADLKQRVLTQHKKSRKAKNMPKTTTIASYVGVFLLIMSLVAVGYQPPSETSGTVAAVAEDSNASSRNQPSVDEMIANTVAGSIAERANMPIAQSIAELSVSLSAESDLAQADETVISKPQIIQPGADGREIKTYIAKSGDTVPSVAEQFSVSTTTLKWANNLTTDSIDVGRELSVPPVDGVVYTVKAGDTPESIAARYSADKDRIISFNDLEISGLATDTKIVIPSATLPETERPGYVAPRAAVYNYSSGSASSASRNNLLASAGNRYAPGYCTWYVYERRAQAGRPIGSFWGNATSWAMNGRAAGFAVNNTPEPGAILQNGGGYGHVAYVESVDASGNVTVREMNYAGWNVVSSRTISAGQASSYNYIH